MKARVLAVLAVLALASSLMPAHADDDPRVTHVKNFLQRIPPGSPGEQRHITLIYGPYVVPPGQDNNRITVDVPVQTGFYTSVFPNLIDVKTGKEPTEQEAHIHHAHWFRVTNDQSYEYYEDVNGMGGLSWVFGTGEERTGGTLNDRMSTSEGYKYGIYLDGGTPQALIFMIHNKQTSTALEAYITLDIDMIYGTRDEIRKAPGGQDIHPLRGVLTGTTQNVQGNKSFGPRSVNGVLTQDYTADFSGTLIASASHMHPGGKWVDVVNMGPKDAAGHFVCAGAGPNHDGDLDGDGIPGTTLFVSKKIDHVAATWPYSEDYQMGGTQGGFRAPIHQGDVIRQYGVYDVDRSSSAGLPAALLRSDPLDQSSPLQIGTLDGNPHSWYAAMSYTGLYSDEENKPAVDPNGVAAADCSASTFASTLKTDTNHHFDFSSNPLETYQTHAWLHVDRVCGTYDPAYGVTAPCDGPPINYVDGQVVNTIQVAAFVYLPGDLSVRDLNGAVSVPLVKQGTTLRLVNTDVALLVRHTFTSCMSPCNGPYFANYPTPDGFFESGKLGNLDYIDGGLTGADTMPYKDIAIDNTFQTGKIYNFYCQIHPSMRGAFKVVA